MAIWRTPKTNWVATDFVNIQDYARIVQNIKYLYHKARGVFGNIPFVDIPETKDYTDFPYAPVLNAIETNLDNINSHTYQIDIGQKKIFYPNRPGLDYAELNRIENGIVALYDILSLDIDNVFSLSFTLGNQRGIRM